MASYNRVLLLGNLTKDPELRYIPSGQAVCTMRMAVSEKYRTREGQDKEDVLFIDVVVWGKQGENCAQYLKKGRPAFVEGRLRIRDFVGRDNQKRYRTEVVANRVQFLGGRDGGAAAVPEEPADAAAAGGAVDEPLPSFDDESQ